MTDSDNATAVNPSTAPPDVQGALTVALNLRQEIEDYIRTGNRQSLVEGLRDQFLANRHLAASKVEEARVHATGILITRMESMSDSMLLRTIETLAKTSDKDLEALFGLGNKGAPMFSFVQNNGAPQQPALPVGDGGTSGTNPVRQTGQVLEAIEHLSKFFANRPKDAPLIEGRTRDAEDIEPVG